jgi:hypothetical protein
MSVKRSYPKHRLRQFFGRRDGTLRSKLLASANEKLDSIRDSSLIEIDSLAERIHKLGQELGQSPDLAKAQEAYRLSNEICGIAGAFGLVHLGKAAYSLCELLDHLNAASKWNWAAVRVHLDGIHSLRTHAENQVEVRDAIVDGLVQVVSHVTAAASLPPPAAAPGAPAKP